jgi:hypothetical protein
VVSDELTTNEEVLEVKHSCCSPKLNINYRYYRSRDNYLGQKSPEWVEALKLSEIDSTGNSTKGSEEIRSLFVFENKT